MHMIIRFCFANFRIVAQGGIQDTKYPTFKENHQSILPIWLYYSVFAANFKAKTIVS